MRVDMITGRRVGLVERGLVRLGFEVLVHGDHAFEQGHLDVKLSGEAEEAARVLREACASVRAAAVRAVLGVEARFG